MEVLILGAEGSGKSLLTRRLAAITTQQHQPPQATGTDRGGDLYLYQEHEAEATIPTTGVEMTRLEVTCEDGSVAATCISLREISSGLASRWPNYIEDCRGILFVIDISDMTLVSSAIVLLHEVFAYKHNLVGKSVGIVYNKADICDAAINANLIDNILRVDELKRQAIKNGYDLTILEGSCMDRNLPASVISWLRALAK